MLRWNVRTPACQSALDAWCNRPENCPHASLDTLHARLDTTAARHPPAWRCYAEATLSADRTKYVSGDTFCTRHEKLSRLLQECEQRAGAEAADPAAAATVKVEVSPVGGVDARPSPSLPTPKSSTPPPPPPPPLPVLQALPTPAHGIGAPKLFDTWLEQCSRAPRCACLVHGTSTAAEALVTRFPRVAFFFGLRESSEAERLVSRLDATTATNAYVMHLDLAKRGARPCQNDVLNPSQGLLTALQALQASNEFFDLQLVHVAAVPALGRPSPATARSLLSLAAATLLLLPSGEGAAAAWRGVLPHVHHAVARSDDAVAAAARLQVEVAADGCGDADGGGGGVGCAGRGAAEAMLVRLRSLERLNLHHLSCWDAPRCHERMYVMMLSLADGPSPPPGEGVSAWTRRMPALYRVGEGGKSMRPGMRTFRTLDEAVAARGKPIPFETGGANLDSLVSLGLLAPHRARLATDFLTIPVGRDMMLWNIVAGRDGAFAIDQEGVVYSDGAIPWAARAMPYCLSVRDCYEKPLAQLCGLPYSQPGRLYGEALTAAAAQLFAAQCTDAARPFPCRQGCRASYEECKRPETLQ